MAKHCPIHKGTSLPPIKQLFRMAAHCPCIQRPITFRPIKQLFRIKNSHISPSTVLNQPLSIDNMYTKYILNPYSIQSKKPSINSQNINQYLISIT